MKLRALPPAFAFALAACNAQPAGNNQAGGEAAGNGAAAGPVYPTYGVHNPPNASPCAAPNCVYVRGPGEPPDPQYPPYWQSRWTMYRVFNNYSQHMPPYQGAPPPPLVAGRDYQISYGATYYDSTWNNGQGAMMEHYEHFCLPILAVAPNFTCSFISLGDTAYFVTYEQDRPAGMPPVCLFSPLNHPPRRDFISHLPYAAGDSAQLGPGAQAYSFWISPSTGAPVQTGAMPDQTANGEILFGYAFAPVNGRLQPSSFYFSGNPGPPANAPIVSQNYTNWAPTQPDRHIWDEASRYDPGALPACNIMPEPASAASLTSRRRPPTWSDIGRWPARRGR